MNKDIEILDMMIENGMPTLFNKLKEINEELNQDNIKKDKKVKLLKERQKINKSLDIYKKQKLKEGGNNE